MVLDFAIPRARLQTSLVFRDKARHYELEVVVEVVAILLFLTLGLNRISTTILKL